MKKDSKRYCDITTPESIHTKDESKHGFAFTFIFGVNWPIYECNRLTAQIIFWQNTLPANIRKWVFSRNKTWRNYKFAWNSWTPITVITGGILDADTCPNLCLQPHSYYSVLATFHPFLICYHWLFTAPLDSLPYQNLIGSYFRPASFNRSNLSFNTLLPYFFNNFLPTFSNTSRSSGTFGRQDILILF